MNKQTTIQELADRAIALIKQDYVIEAEDILDDMRVRDEITKRINMSGVLDDPRFFREGAIVGDGVLFAQIRQL